MAETIDRKNPENPSGTPEKITPETEPGFNEQGQLVEKIKAAIAETQGLFIKELQNQLAEARQLEDQIAKKIEASPSLGDRRQTAQTISAELDQLVNLRKYEQVSREEFIKIVALDRKLKDILDAARQEHQDLEGQRRQLYADTRQEDFNYSQRRDSEGRAASQLLAQHRQKSPIQRGLQKISPFSLGRQDRLRLKQAQLILEELDQLESRLKQRSHEHEELVQKSDLKHQELAEIDSGYRQTFWDRDLIISRYLNQVLVGPINEFLQKRVEELSNQPELIDAIVENYFDQFIKPGLSKELKREIKWELTRDEWVKLIEKEWHNEQLAYFIRGGTGAGHLSRVYLSRQGAPAYGLEATDDYIGVECQYDPVAESVTLQDDTGKIFDNVSEREIYKLHLRCQNLKPGQDFGDYQIVEFDPINYRARFQSKEDLSEIQLEGAEAIDRFFVEQFAAHPELLTGESKIYLHNLHPRAYQYAESVISWQIELTDQSVNLTREVGTVNPGDFDRLSEEIKLSLRLQDYSERMAKEETIRKFFADYPRHFNFYQSVIFAPRPVIQALILMKFGPDLEQLALAYPEPLAQGTINRVGFNFTHHRSRIDRHELANQFAITHDYQTVESVMNAPTNKQIFANELAEAHDFRMMSARHWLAKNPNDSYYARKYLLEHGSAEDLENILLYFFDSPHCQDDLLATNYQQNPAFFQEKLQFVNQKLVGITALTEIFQEFAEQDDQTNPQQIAERLLGVIAPVFREAIKRKDFEPEEKYRIFRILSGLSSPYSTVKFENLVEPDRHLDPIIAQELMVFLRTLPSHEEKLAPAELTAETVQLFADDISQLYRMIQERQILPLGEIIYQPDLLGFLARHPDSVKDLLTLPQQVPEFIDLIKPGGELELNRLPLLRYLFANGQLLERAREMVKIFAGVSPLPEKIIAFVEARLKDALAKSTSEYPVVVIIDNQPKAVKFSELDLGQKIAALKRFADEAIGRSRSPEAKRAATERNQPAPEIFQFKTGMYLHGLPANVFSEVLRNGNLCGEFLGAQSKEDAYPFHVDYSYIEPGTDLGNKTFVEILAQLPSHGFGQQVVNGQNLQIILVTDREKAEWEKDVTYFATGRGPHTLILGASPSTEIHAVLLRDPEGSLKHIVESCLEEEHYLPAYDLKTGELVFPYEQYQKMLDQIKPYRDANEFLAATAYLEPYNFPQANGVHRFTLREHLLLTTQKAVELSSLYDLTERENLIVQIAARLHDVGKGHAGVQEVDNPVVASQYLSQIRGLSTDEKELILNLIRYDELLGDILQNKKTPESFDRLFPNKRHQKMLLTLYKADVQAIDGNVDDNSVYRQWRVAEKLRELGLER